MEGKLNNRVIETSFFRMKLLMMDYKMQNQIVQFMKCVEEF